MDGVRLGCQPRKRGIPEVSKYRSEVGLGPTTEQLMDPFVWGGEIGGWAGFFVEIFGAPS